MAVVNLYQSRVDRIRLEIAGDFDRFRGSVYYQADDGRFVRGQLDAVLDVVLTMFEEIQRRDRLEQLFIANFEPVIPHGSAHVEETEAMFRDFQARLKGRPRASIGTRYLLNGVSLGLEAGLGLFRDCLPRSRGASAEDSALRLVALDKSGGSGWDLLHENGASHLGRWDENLEEKPGSISTGDRSLVEAALKAARAVLERRFGSR